MLIISRSTKALSGVDSQIELPNVLYKNTFQSVASLTLSDNGIAQTTSALYDAVDKCAVMNSAAKYITTGSVAAFNNSKDFKIFAELKFLGAPFGPYGHVLLGFTAGAYLTLNYPSFGFTFYPTSTLFNFLTTLDSNIWLNLMVDWNAATKTLSFLVNGVVIYSRYHATPAFSKAAGILHIGDNQGTYRSPANMKLRRLIISTGN